MGHLSIYGVMSFREKEVHEYLRRKPVWPASQNLAVVSTPEVSKELNIILD